MKNSKRIIAILLAVLLLSSVMPLPTFAQAENTPKEEVVYINLNADGSVKEIVVVNIFELTADGKIIDYGKYQNLRNMTTTDHIGYTDETVTIDAKAGKLYYEGKLDSNVMPWNMAIRYYMDGVEYKASDIAGKSGDLKITIHITENENCIGNFFEGFALQASVTLDTKKCTNIHAEGATVANVGSNKQLSYTIFPNKGANIEITAKVKDFEMNAIAINGIKLSLALNVDNAFVQDMVGELVGAVQTLDQGVTDLNNGTKEVYDGTSTLNNKVGELASGVGKLSSGAGDLSSGLSTITSKNKTLTDGAYSVFKGLCKASEKIVNAELKDKGLGTITLTPENYGSVLPGLIKLLGNSEQASAVADLKKQLDNYSTFYGGLKDYTSAVSSASSGAKTLKTNMETLNKNVGLLDDAVGELNDGVKQLYNGTTEMKKGTEEFAKRTEGFESEVGSQIDDILVGLTGSNVETTSFVSEKNTNIKSVQFVIRTEAIEAAEEVNEQPVVQEKLNLWQKLLRLFGLY